MSTNMELIDAITVESAQPNIEFTSIPNTFTDLCIKYSLRTVAAGSRDDIKITINSDTGSNYSAIRVFGIDGGTSSQSSSGTPSDLNIGSVNGDGATSNTFANIEFYIANYAESSYKSISFDWVTENNSAASFVLGLSTILWSSSSAITSFKIESKAGNNFLPYSTAYLYGISNVTSGSKATGGIVSSDGTYWYHMFPFSGTFTPTENITADLLVVAGGGGGGRTGGGGGAGGLRGITSSSMTTTAYTVTVGAGGVGNNVDGQQAGDGGNSSVSGSGFSTITGTGGGGAASYGAGSGRSGGSGGGGNGVSAPGGSGNAGSYSSVEGYAGGAGGNQVDRAGGGGGAGEVGATSTGTAGGNGGNGSSAYSSWGIATQTGENVSGTYWYAGGGGGASGTSSGGPNKTNQGAGGNGGGGDAVFNSGATNYAEAGLVNTGGGGGAGSGNGAAGAAGGSGLVIIRYAI